MSPLLLLSLLLSCTPPDDDSGVSDDGVVDSGVSDGGVSDGGSGDGGSGDGDGGDGDGGADGGSDTGDPGTAPTDVDLSPLAVHWVPSATGLTTDRLLLGLDWNLTLLGALPQADGSHLLEEGGKDRLDFVLDPGQLRVPAARHAALTDALLELRSWEDAAGSTDLGRLFMLTLHEPWRYYAITGACRDLAQWEEVRQTDDADRYDVSVSLLADGDRIIELPPADEPVASVAFLIATSSASFGPDWEPEEFETIDMMASAQQRFATYDSTGVIQPEAEEAVVPAGQPGRCVWCHEGNFMVGTSANPSSDEAIPYVEWASRMADWQDQLGEWRAGLDTRVDWVEYHTHTWGELIVREFLLPTLDRAAVEWGLSEEDARALVEAEGLWMGEDEEWPDRGEVLLREDVDAVLADRIGHPPPPVLSDARKLPDGAVLRGSDWASWLDCRE